MNGLLLSGKRDFDYEKEEYFFLSFMRLLLIISILFMVFGVYSQYRQFRLERYGKTAEAKVLSGGRSLSFVADDGNSYSVDVSGMFFTSFGDTVTVYYMDSPYTAVPLTDIKFFLIIYSISLVGIALSLWQIRRIRLNISRNKPLPDED